MRGSVLPRLIHSGAESSGPESIGHDLKKLPPLQAHSILLQFYASFYDTCEGGVLKAFLQKLPFNSLHAIG